MRRAIRWFDTITVNAYWFALTTRAQVLTRLRVNNTLYALTPAADGRKGRPRKYGARLGSASELAAAYQAKAKPYDVSLYGKCREVLAHDRVLMLKTLRCPVRVVWVYRGSQWIALVTTDLALTVQQIIDDLERTKGNGHALLMLDREMGARPGGNE